ncbi:MAG: nuclear transport factor 2 family protein [Solirubrobacteraceae bacterium]
MRLAIEAFNRRDLDEAMRYADDEVEVDWTRSGGVEAGVYRGRDATRAFWSTFLEAFDRVLVETEEFIDCGDRIIAPNRTRFWGRDGIIVEARGVPVVTLRDGLIVQWQLHRDRADAQRVAGPPD